MPLSRLLRKTRPNRQVGLVTALYRGKANGATSHGSILPSRLPSRLEALGIATEFMPGVLLSKLIEGGLHYGLGSTLAVRREALEKIGGLLSIVDYLADDYELGARIAKAGYRVEVSAEVVETSVPAYSWRGFFDHQLRWLRTVRCSRPAGYAGLIFTHGLAWALLNVLASGLSPLSLWLLGLSFFLRLAQAMTVGAGVLGDHEVLPNLWLLPLRDVIAMAPVGGWLLRRHDRVARRAIHAERWKAPESKSAKTKLVKRRARCVSGPKQLDNLLNPLLPARRLARLRASPPCQWSGMRPGR